MRKQPFRIGRRQSIQDTGRTVQRDATGDRVVVQERVVERRHEGEAYVAGFVGYTLGHSFANVDGTGGLSTTGIESLDLANSVAYGMKVGYFLPTRRLNWLGFELEAFNTPRIWSSKVRFLDRTSA